MAQFKLDPSFAKNFKAAIDNLGQEGSLAFSAALDKNISLGSRSGRQYPELPHRSSSADEYPQEQFGGLRKSIDVRKVGKLWAGGFFDTDYEKISDLEFGNATLVKRQPLVRTTEDKATQSAILKAFKEAKPI